MRIDVDLFDLQKWLILKRAIPSLLVLPALLVFKEHREEGMRQRCRAVAAKDNVSELEIAQLKVPSDFTPVRSYSTKSK